MAVPDLGRKFWTMTSWTWPCRRCDAAMASRAAIRSLRSSPIPIRIPVVNGMESCPAASRVASRRAGCLSGAPRWQSRSSTRLSTIIPWDGETRRRAASSSKKRAPALACGSSPVSARTRSAIASRYSSVDPCPWRDSHSAAAGYRSSGRSPRVNNASWHPAEAPRWAMARTSSGLR